MKRIINNAPSATRDAALRAPAQRDAPEPGSPIAGEPSAGRIPKAKRPKMTDAEQSAEFEKVAREHGAEGKEAEFDGMLRKLAKPKAGWPT